LVPEDDPEGSRKIYLQQAVRVKASRSADPLEAQGTDATPPAFRLLGRGVF